jgi:HTH-type transcriptional regulator / antitoxin HipB
MQLRNLTQLGALIRQRRGEQGMTQQQLAERIGVTRRWVVQVESGNGNPTTNHLFKCLDVLGIQIGELPQQTDTPGNPSLRDLMTRYRR